MAKEFLAGCCRHVICAVYAISVSNKRKSYPSGVQWWCLMFRISSSLLVRVHGISTAETVVKHLFTLRTNDIKSVTSTVTSTVLEQENALSSTVALGFTHQIVLRPFFSLCFYPLIVNYFLLQQFLFLRQRMMKIILFVQPSH